MKTCIHCGREVEMRANGGTWFHVYRNPENGIINGGLNRCQSSDVPYGHDAHAEMPCPDHCMGSWSEGGNCTHRPASSTGSEQP